MAYQKTIWVDGVSPYLNAINLNNLEVGLESASAKADTNKNDIAVNTGNIDASTTKIHANTADIVEIKAVNESQTTKIDTNTFNISKNTDAIGALSSGETPQGEWTPTSGQEYPAAELEVEGYSWYISGIDINGYTFSTGILLGDITHNMDKLLYTVNGWSLIKADTRAVENLAFGNLKNTLFELPLKNSLEMIRGAGTATFTRASTATYTDRYGVLQTALADAPRFVDEGLLVEGTSTNLCLQSEDFTTTWTTTGVDPSITGDQATAPDRTLSADLFTFSGSDASRVLQYISSSSDLAAASVFVKKDTSDVVILSISETTAFTISRYQFKFSDETFIYNSGGLTALRFSVDKLNDGWYRLNLTVDFVGISHTTKSIQIENRDASEYSNAVYLYGGQLEESYFTTSYVSTTTTAVTRVSELLAIDALNNYPNLFNQISLALDVHILGTSNSNGDVIQISGFSNSNMDKIQTFGSFGVFLMYWYNLQSSNTNLPIKTEKQRILRITDKQELNTYNDGVFFGSDIATLTDYGNIPNKINIIGTDRNVKIVSNLRYWDRALTATEARLA